MRPFAATVTAALTAAALLALPSPARAALDEFDSCTQLVDYARASLDDGSYPEYVSAFDGWLDARRPERDPSLPEPTSPDRPGEEKVVQDTADSPASSAAGAGSEDSSTTNNQEAGVDEPDVVKNDGELLYVFAGDRLRIYSGRADVPTLVGELGLNLADGTLLRSGDKLLAIGQKPQPLRGAQRPSDPGSSTARWADYPETVRFIEIDISQPAQPSVLRTLDAPGRLITARQVGTTARIVVDSEPDIDIWGFEDLTADEQEDVEAGVSLGDLVPKLKLRSSVSGKRYVRPMAACDDISRPTTGSHGVELLTVFTVELERGLIAVDRKGVMASPQVVYAAADTLYVGSARSTGWYDDDAESLPEDTYTDIYAFDTKTAGETTYAGSGRVLGLPLSQYAFSEWNGDLRVATTTNPWWLHEDEAPADNRVTVLRLAGGGSGALRQVGLLTGMGKGETIYAVRFYGERAYIVTFRQTDPLYTVDLSNPAQPAILGQLKIPGYSAYLHPLGDDLLLGIGQDADDKGREKGAQVSLFDVSDPKSPKRLAARGLGPGYTDSDYDPHAFLWWPRRQTAFVPYSGYGYWDGPQPSKDYVPSALVALQAKAGPSPNLVELGRILHGPAWDHPTPQRAVVMGDRLFSISQLGIGSNRVDDLSPLGYTPFLPAVAETPAATTP